MTYEKTATVQIAMSENWFPSITEAARAQFRVNLEAFFKACPEWTRYRLLTEAGMDQQLIRRVLDKRKGFQTAALDRLQGVMNDIVNGKLENHHHRPPPSKKGKRNGRTNG